MRGEKWEQLRGSMTSCLQKGHPRTCYFWALQQLNFREELSYLLSPLVQHSCLPHHPVRMPTFPPRELLPRAPCWQTQSYVPHLTHPCLHYIRSTTHSLKTFLSWILTTLPEFSSSQGSFLFSTQDICLPPLNWFSCSQPLNGGVPWGKFPITHALFGITFIHLPMTWNTIYILTNSNSHLPSRLRPKLWLIHSNATWKSAPRCLFAGHPNWPCAVLSVTDSGLDEGAALTNSMYRKEIGSSCFGVLGTPELPRKKSTLLERPCVVSLRCHGKRERSSHPVSQLSSASYCPFKGTR